MLPGKYSTCYPLPTRKNVQNPQRRQCSVAALPRPGVDAARPRTRGSGDPARSTPPCDGDAIGTSPPSVAPPAWCYEMNKMSPNVGRISKSVPLSGRIWKSVLRDKRDVSHCWPVSSHAAGGGLSARAPRSSSQSALAELVKAESPMPANRAFCAAPAAALLAPVKSKLPATAD